MGQVIKTGLGVLVSRLSQPLLSFVLFWFSSRILSLSDFGIYVLLMGLIILFQVLATLGLSPFLTREISLGKRPGVWVGSLLWLLGPFSLVAWAVLVGLAIALGYSHEAIVGSIIIGLSLPFGSFSQSMESVFIAQGQAKAMVYLGLGENIFRVAISVAALLMGWGLYGLLWCYVISRAGGCLWSYILYRKYRNSPLQSDPDCRRMLWRAVPTFGVMVIAATLYFRVDILAISSLLDEENLAYYGVAMRLFGLGLIIPDSFVTAVFPEMTRNLSSDRPAAMRFFGTVARLLCSACFLGIFATLLFSDFFITLIFGEKFAPAAPIMNILILMLPCYAINALSGYLIQAAKREGVEMLLVVAGTLLCLLLNVAGIYYMGLPGAAWATCLANITMLGAHLIIIHKIVGFFTPTRSTLAMLAAMIASLALLALLPSANWAILAAGLLFVVIMIVFKGLQPYDLAAVKALLKRGRK